MSEEKQKTLLEKAAESQVWKSIFRGGGVPRNRRHLPTDQGGNLRGHDLFQAGGVTCRYRD